MKYTDDMFEGYLDAEQKFYDYRTRAVSGSNIFDENTTGVSFYDQFLGTSELDYLRDKKNLVGSIVYMSPNEYYKECSEHAFGRRKVTAQSLKAQRAADKSTLDHLKQVIQTYKRRFPLPYINYAEGGQEGLHRMYVAGELFGWDSPKHPVLVIHWADEARHQREVKAKFDFEIESAIQKGVKDALQYNFTDIEDLRTQLEFSLDRTFEFIDEVKKPVNFQLTEKSDNCIVKVLDVEYSFPKEDIQFVEKDWDDDDLDDIELDGDIDAFLAKYLK